MCCVRHGQREGEHNYSVRTLDVNHVCGVVEEDLVAGDGIEGVIRRAQRIVGQRAVAVGACGAVTYGIKRADMPV